MNKIVTYFLLKICNYLPSYFKLKCFNKGDKYKILFILYSLNLFHIAYDEPRGKPHEQLSTLFSKSGGYPADIRRISISGPKTWLNIRVLVLNLLMASFDSYHCFATKIHGPWMADIWSEIKPFFQPDPYSKSQNCSCNSSWKEGGGSK